LFPEREKVPSRGEEMKSFSKNKENAWRKEGKMKFGAGYWELSTRKGRKGIIVNEEEEKRKRGHN